MIYVTGDCHGDYTRFYNQKFREQSEMTKQDYVIVLGDMGIIWDAALSEEERQNIRFFERLPFTTLFIDGNHENFDRLNAMPVSTWNGGKVHRLSSSLIHLLRGQVFELEGKTFFAFGGAQSHDIDGGILDPFDPDFEQNYYYARRCSARPFRINHWSWWKEELPSHEEMREGLENLKAHHNRVSYILTHCTSTSTQAVLSAGSYTPDILTDYLERIRQTVSYEEWYFGHYHEDRQITDKECLLYETITRIL